MALPLYEYILFITLTVLLLLHTTWRGIRIEALRGELQAAKDSNHQLSKEVGELKNKPPPPREHSLELTEFLSDAKSYGYGFVRVDPASVIQRSPRGDIP